MIGKCALQTKNFLRNGSDSLKLVYTETVLRRALKRYNGAMEKQNTFTLAFFPESNRDALKFCGANSGRDFDKVKETGLHPVTLEGGVGFEEAKLVLICRKQFAADMDMNAIPQNIADRFYHGDAAHKMYIGEILAAYVQA